MFRGLTCPGCGAEQDASRGAFCNDCGECMYEGPTAQEEEAERQLALWENRSAVDQLAELAADDG